HLVKGFFQRLVATIGAIGIDGRAGLLVDATKQDRLEVGHDILSPALCRPALKDGASLVQSPVNRAGQKAKVSRGALSSARFTRLFGASPRPLGRGGHLR